MLSRAAICWRLTLRVVLGGAYLFLLTAAGQRIATDNYSTCEDFSVDVAVLSFPDTIKILQSADYETGLAKCFSGGAELKSDLDFYVAAQLNAAKGIQMREMAADGWPTNSSLIVAEGMLSYAAGSGNADAAQLRAYIKDYVSFPSALHPSSTLNRQRLETAYLLAACLGSRMAIVRMGERLLTERGRHGTDLLRRYQFQADGYAEALTDALGADLEASTAIMESLLKRRVNVDRFVVDYADTEVHSLARLSLSMVSLVYRAEMIEWASRIANDRGLDADFRFQYALVDEAEGFATLHCRETLMALQYRNVVAVYPKQLLFVDQFGEEIVQPY